jgi:hypothetical protein
VLNLIGEEERDKQNPAKVTFHFARRMANTHRATILRRASARSGRPLVIGSNGAALSATTQRG